MNDADIDLDPLDRIDRSIEIDAPADRVRALVTRPGWWINQSAVDPDPDLRTEGEVTVLTHPTYGEFRLETVESRPLSYVAFHWQDRGPTSRRWSSFGSSPARAA